MKLTPLIFLITLFTLFACKEKKEPIEIVELFTPINWQQEEMATVTGKIRNLQVYPHIKELKLTIYDFDGNSQTYVSQLEASGEFRIDFYPLTNREIKIYPIEDVMIVAPGDSFYVEADFKDLYATNYSGDRSELNKHITNFRSGYLGRYDKDSYKMTCDEFKASCDIEKRRNYSILETYNSENNTSDEFQLWAQKKIELDYANALFDYPMQYYNKNHHRIMTGKDIEDLSNYYTFINMTKPYVEESLVMLDYFDLASDFQMYGFIKNKVESQKIKPHVPQTLNLEESYYSYSNTYLSQIILCKALHTIFRSNVVELSNENIHLVDSLVTDPFLRKNISIRFQRVRQFNKNPMAFTNALFGKDDRGNRIGQAEVSLVEEIVASNPSKVVYVDFWSTWCPPCIINKTYSKQLMNYFEGKDVEFVFICIISKEENWKERVEEFDMPNAQHYFCDEQESRDIQKQFEFKGIPYYLLIDQSGAIVDYGGHLLPQGCGARAGIDNLLKGLPVHHK